MQIKQNPEPEFLAYYALCCSKMFPWRQFSTILWAFAFVVTFLFCCKILLLLWIFSSVVCFSFVASFSVCCDFLLLLWDFAFCCEIFSLLWVFAFVVTLFCCSEFSTYFPASFFCCKFLLLLRVFNFILLRIFHFVFAFFFCCDGCHVVGHRTNMQFLYRIIQLFKMGDPVYLQY